MDDVWIVMTTFASEKDAKQVAQELLAERLTACANLLPGGTSLYYWQGELCEEQEVVVLMKTTRVRYPELQQALRSKHPYDEPEVLAFAAETGSDGYCGFVRAGVRPE